MDKCVNVRHPERQVGDRLGWETLGWVGDFHRTVPSSPKGWTVLLVIKRTQQS